MIRTAKPRAPIKADYKPGELKEVHQHDGSILRLRKIEDDYDAEFNLDNHPLPALKASDSSGRVIYLSSLSKAFSPGLRIGGVTS